MLLRQLVERGLDAVADLEFVGTAAARQREADHRLAVEQCELGRIGGAVGDRRERGQPHVPAIAEGDAVVAQRLRIGDRADRAHGLLATVEFGLAARALDLGRGQLLADLAGGDAQRLQRLWIQVHPHLPLDAADAVDRGHAFHAVQRAHHVAIDEP